MSRVPIRRALISVSDKSGLVAFARRLDAAGVEIVSSGGTARALAEAGIPVTPVADVTNAPEMLDGRVKTLHPAVHAGILADLGRDTHRADLEARSIKPFGLVAVNLYPFEDTIARDPRRTEAIEQIDIGGPALIRAAAKNHEWVTVAVSPDRYDEIADAVEQGGTTEDLRADLAREAFFRTAEYDAAIVNWMEREGADRLALPMVKAASLRYGENPSQAAALYAGPHSGGWWARADQIQGKEMSFNNFADADAAWRLANDLPPGSVAILKHMNACGVATADTPADAFERAWGCDPQSAFGGIVAVNGQVDGDVAEAVAERFVEVVVAASVTPDAQAALAARKSLRVLIAPPPSQHDLDVRTIDDGFLVQKRDFVSADPSAWEALTRPPSPPEIENLAMAWVIAAHTKSNAVVLVNDGAAVGVGAGDQSRVGAVHRALVRAGDRAVGSVCASDAFFPFRDGPDMLGSAGVVAIVEPGGSVRDDDVIASAVEYDMALMFTGERHFRH